MLDAANGMGAVGAEAIFAHLPVETVRMFFELDGSFPNHPADPLLEENRRDIVARVLAEQADLGIAWDGDADRCFFIDDRGQYVPGDFVTAILGEAFARREPGAKIVYDVRASRAVPDRVTAAGGVPLMNRVGHAFIKKRMRDEVAVFGGEVSGPLLLPRELVRRQRDDPCRADARVPGPRRPSAERDPGAAARALPHLGRDQLARRRTSSVRSQRIEERYRDGRITRLDGISVDYDDWHFNVRPSNTEPLLRLNLEAASQRGHGAAARRGDLAHPRVESP